MVAQLGHVTFIWWSLVGRSPPTSPWSWDRIDLRRWRLAAGQPRTLSPEVFWHSSSFRWQARSLEQDAQIGGADSSRCQSKASSTALDGAAHVCPSRRSTRRVDPDHYTEAESGNRRPREFRCTPH